MHKRLKVRLWKEIDFALGGALAFRSSDRSLKWRLYRSESAPGIFIESETHDIAGGGFKFNPGISQGKVPSPKDLPFSKADSSNRGFAYCGDGPFAGLVAYCQVNVELGWQTPSAGLVLKALETAEGRALLASLGVTETEKHYMLSYEIIEALGVGVPDHEFDLVVAKFKDVLASVVRDEIVPAVVRLAGIDKIV